jgi:hypothetical protein
VRNTNFTNVYTSESQTDQEFRREESPIRVHADAAQRLSAEKFCCTIYVANVKPKPEAICNSIHGGVDEAQWRIGALEAIPNNHGCLSRLSAFNEACKIGDTKLSVAIGVGEVVVPRCRKP